MHGMDTGSGWTISEGLLSWENVVLEWVSEVNNFILVMLVFSFLFLWLLEGVEGEEEVPVVISSRLLFF